MVDEPVEALTAAVAIQRGMADPGNGLELQVRCGLHVGEVERRDDDYFGGAVNRAARIMGAAHGGQILVSSDVRDELADWAAIPQDPLVLKGFDTPVTAYDLHLSR